MLFYLLPRRSPTLRGCRWLTGSGPDRGSRAGAARRLALLTATALFSPLFLSSQLSSSVVHNHLFGATSPRFDSRAHRWVFSGIRRKVLLRFLPSLFAMILDCWGIRFEVIWSAFSRSSLRCAAAVAPAPASGLDRDPGSRVDAAHRTVTADGHRPQLAPPPPLSTGPSPALLGRRVFTVSGPDPVSRASAASHRGSADRHRPPLAARPSSSFTCPKQSCRVHRPRPRPRPRPSLTGRATSLRDVPREDFLSPALHDSTSPTLWLGAITGPVERCLHRSASAATHHPRIQ